MRNALLKVDNNIQKLDTVCDGYIQKVDRPVSPRYKVADVVADLRKFNGKVIIQTMFMEGEYDGKSISNTGDAYVQPWLEAVKDIAPSQVMIYTIDRETPAHNLRKASRETLDGIKEMVEAAGIDCTASY